MTAYFDCFSGIAGDMAVGALLHAGLSFDYLQSELAKLGLNGYTLEANATMRSGIGGIHFRVITDNPLSGPPTDHPEYEHHHHGRHLSDIEALIGGSGLSEGVKGKAVAVFRRLGAAEAKVHGVPIEDIHFHEVGATDSIVDIVGACIGLEALGVTRVTASPLPVSHGTVRVAHGLMPVPVPAVAELCAGIPTYPVDVNGEIVTPTGAALLAALADGFGPPPAMTPTATGYGAGTKDFGDRANLLRVILGEETGAASGWETRTLTLLETNVDDMNPQVFDHVFDLCFQAGALDVWLAPIHMKKGRAAVTLSVLCDASQRDALLNVLAVETTTLGVRVSTMQRFSLPREMVTVQTPYGPVEVKVAHLPSGVEKAHPEYESARAAALARNAPLQDVMQAAMEGWTDSGTDVPV